MYTKHRLVNNFVVTPFVFLSNIDYDQFHSHIPTWHRHVSWKDVNLHIFEPRYKQLIKECYDSQKAFGIPAVINNKVSELGTLVEVKEITNVYENGELDIKSKGVRVFRVLEVITDVPEKPYSGAIVNYPDNLEEGNRELMIKIVNGIKELHKLLNVTKTFRKPDEELTTYAVAHHAMLTHEEEYEFLWLMQELSDRNT
jgi:Lon protease-like protein